MPEGMSIKPYLESKKLYLTEFSKNMDIHKGYNAAGEAIELHGMRISRIVDCDCNEISEANILEHKECDISCLAGGDKCIVAVVSTDGITVHWCAFEIIKGNDDNKQFIIGKKWMCNGEECKLLDETFPEYFDHCAVSGSEFYEKNKEFIPTDEGDKPLDLPTATEASNEENS